MNRTEAAQLCRLVKTVCPSQAFDEFSPEAWTLVLGGYDYDDAKAAVVAIASTPNEGRSTYIEPGHIIAGIRRIRSKRLEATPLPTPPDGLTVAESVEWQRRTRDQIAAGTYRPEPAQITTADPERVRAILATATSKPSKPSKATGGRLETDEPTDAAALEAERRRQLAAIKARIESPNA